MAPGERDTHWFGEEFDRRAATYDESTMHHWQAERAVRLLAPVPGQRILDVATGTGLAVRAVDQVAPQTDVVGIDVSTRMLALARKRTRELRRSFVRADAHRLPFRPAVFDAVLCVSSVSYFTDLGLAIGEWRRVARSGAVVVLSTPAADGFTVNRLVRAAAAAHGVTLADPHVELGSDVAIRTSVEPHGLSIDDVISESFPDPLPGSPEDAFAGVIRYGFAGHLEALPAQLQQRIFTSFRRSHGQAVRAGDSSQEWLFVRCRAD